MSPNPDLVAIRVLLDWAAELCLCEVDAPMLARLKEPSSREDLLRVQPDLGAWFDLPQAQAIAQGQEAYAASFLLPDAPGLRLAGFTQGETERLGPALADELGQLLAALSLGPDAKRFGNLPADHVAIALSALGALVAREPRPNVMGLADAHFIKALGRWTESLSGHPKVHPLYQALGKICQALLEEVLELFSDPGPGNTVQLPVLQ